MLGRLEDISLVAQRFDELAYAVAGQLFIIDN
jgi:hypothetical protein